MKILYFHGLDGYLTADKKQILETFGDVHADQINYRNYMNRIEEFLQKYIRIEADLIIGNSLGGLVAYWLSKYKNKPALLLNPALDYSAFSSASLPVDTALIRNQQIQITLGLLDDIVSPDSTVSYLNKHESGNPVPYFINSYSNLNHHIPAKVLGLEIQTFLNRLALTDLNV